MVVVTDLLDLFAEKTVVSLILMLLTTKSNCLFQNVPEKDVHAIKIIVSREQAA